MKNLALLAVSALFSLVAAELALRIVFDPIDHLKVDLVEDPVLNHRIDAHASGHDEWGFRNKAGVRAAEIVAVGDSMTYGIMATADEAWPMHLQRMSGRAVYSAALGGYGPLHYLHLVKRALKEIKPEAVIVALYFGNDLMDAYNLAYSSDAWADWRDPETVETLDASEFVFAERASGRFLGGLRSWLASNSMLYRIVTQSALFDGVRRREAGERVGDAFFADHLGERILIDVDRVLPLVDRAHPRIVEGRRLTLKALNEIADATEAAGAKLYVALFPVKEDVAHPDLTGAAPPALAVSLDQLAENMTYHREWLAEALAARNVPLIVLKPVLQQALAEEMVYPMTDGHPNGRGYARAAQAILDRIGE